MKINVINRRSWSIAATFFVLAVSATLLGCSMIDEPQSTPAPETNVKNYYTAVSTTGMHYDYAITSANSLYYPPSGTLGMDMQGPSDTAWNMPLYACLWSYNNWGAPATWYYGLTDSQAINFGVEISQGTYADSWVDLQAPLDSGASWTFTSQGENVTAVITKYGSSAQVNGNSYGNVLMVQFTGNAGTTGTEWFAKGTGLIYSNITRPSGTVQSQLQDVVQK